MKVQRNNRKDKGVAQRSRVVIRDVMGRVALLCRGPVVRALLLRGCTEKMNTLFLPAAFVCYITHLSWQTGPLWK